MDLKDYDYAFNCVDGTCYVLKDRYGTLDKIVPEEVMLYFLLGTDEYSVAFFHSGKLMATCRRGEDTITNHAGK